MLRPILHRALGLILLFGPACAAEKPNVLLLLVDDLKPALGCYGDSVVKSPAIDKLAASGLRFEQAYCNQAVCAPSRFNFMLGSRSTSTGLYGLGMNLRERLPDAVTLPQYFRKHGYKAQSLGKIYHIGHGNEGDPGSWSVPHFKDKVVEYVLEESTHGEVTREEAYFGNIKTGKPNKQLPRGAAWEAPEVEDEAYADGRVAAETIRRLRAAAEADEPFFIAAGFARPHLPFTAPKKYWDLYDPADFELADVRDFPDGSPKVAHKHGGEIAQYKPVPESGDIPDDMARQLIHGYYASISYMDAQVGKVLDALDELDLADNTIVLLWGDHGFHLGDHSIWTKHTNYEQANRIPLLIRAPGVTRPGTHSGQLAETVDIYPTLAALAGLPAPEVPQPIDGDNLLPVLKDPSKRVSDHAYHAFPRAKMGRAIRTERYRLVEWKRPGAPRSTAELELYDYQEDPQETKNLADSHPAIVKKLRAILDQYPEAAQR